MGILCQEDKLAFPNCCIKFVLTGHPDDILNTWKFLNARKHQVLILSCSFALAPAPLLEFIPLPNSVHCFQTFH